MQEYYTKLDVHHYNHKGKPVYSYKCNICNNKYINTNNAAAHCRECLKRKENAQAQRGFPILEAFHITPEKVPEDAVTPVKITPRPFPDAPISMEHSALIELIADMNIPYTQLNSMSWEAFIHSLNPGFKIPSSEKLRDLIVEYSNQCLEEGLQDFKGLTCGLAVDGATLIALHTYAYILVNPNGLRVAGFKVVDDQRGTTLAAATADIISECGEHGIFISGVVSDNAKSLVNALTNMNQNDPLSLRTLIGLAVLRCACAAHTGQLAVNDVMKSSATLESFFKNITSLLKWIDNRCSDFKKVCKLKLPKFIATRWNTLASCGSFIEKNKNEINTFIANQVQLEQDNYNSELIAFQQGRKKTSPEQPVPPPVTTIPIAWSAHTAALNVIADFTNQIEGDLILQQDLYVAHRTVEAKLEQMVKKK